MCVYVRVCMCVRSAMLSERVGVVELVLHSLVSSRSGTRGKEGRREGGRGKDVKNACKWVRWEALSCVSVKCEEG